MIPQELIRRKRDGHPLSGAEINAFIRGVTDQSITEGQVAAFAMAVFFRGLSLAERIALTLAMRDSGETLSWEDMNLPGPVIDKHSTGGVGDLVSLVLGPMLSACGGCVPMISGPGLGHTGGTLDKLQSIPGYNVHPDTNTFRNTVRQTGLAIIGQTRNLAPADQRLYAIRDTTGTVESIDLITSSILSKKLAAGLHALVMDVKVGSGAFMPDQASARELARSITEVANGAGTRCTALLTDMNQSLASSAGNAVEVLEAIRFLTSPNRNPRLTSVVFALGEELLQLAGLARSGTEATRRLQRALDSGEAGERFQKMVAALGGPSNLLEDPGSHLPAAPVIKPAHSTQTGFAGRINTRALGMSVVELGGGRTRPAAAIDHAVGFSEVIALGAAVGPGRPLATIHARSEEDWARAADQLRQAVLVTETPPANTPTILERIP